MNDVENGVRIITPIDDDITAGHRIARKLRNDLRGLAEATHGRSDSSSVRRWSYRRASGINPMQTAGTGDAARTQANEGLI
jgi:hypothetical protein